METRKQYTKEFKLDAIKVTKKWSHALNADSIGFQVLVL